MIRLKLSFNKAILTLLLFFVSFGQQSYGQSYTQLMGFADEKMIEGDFFYAIQYYKKAMLLDSTGVEINWKYAEALRRYKNYPKAAHYYEVVYKKESAKIYPRSIFWLATMQHYNGKYDEAIENWKICKKAFKKKKKSYEYKKSQAEIKSCLWAKKAIIDTTDYELKQLDEPINTKDTELAPFLHDKKLYYTSLKADSVNYVEELYTEEYSLQIYSSEQQDSVFQTPIRLKGVYKSGFHSANGSYSPDGTRFYFSRCNSNYDCKIFVGKVKNDKIVDIDSLGDVINTPGAITTMPHITQINGKEYLFFCSNKIKTQGGLDIWYSALRNENQYGKARNLDRAVNSIDDDISPFYDTLENKLYFSSSYHPGFGGHDLFYAQDNNKQMRFMKVFNMGIPFNTSQNDTYLVKDTDEDIFYWSSNRVGVNYAKNPTCCNDLFSAALPPIIVPPSRFESLEDLNKHLPVKLYFHNDEPNPRTRDSISTLTYMTSYDAYLKLKSEYHKQYSEGLDGDAAEDAKEDIEDFFVQYVEQGVIDLNEFLRLLLPELEKGFEIEITVKGFASPLAKTDYNVWLTKRRISSLMKFLRIYKGGVLKPYLNGTASNGGSLSFVKIPFGEYTADQLISDNPNDAKNSVYSRKAALERKIEIQSVSLVTKDSSYAKMDFEKQAHDFGDSKQGDILTYDYQFKNNGDKVLEIGEISTDCDCLTYELSQSVLSPGETAKISVSWDTSSKIGITYSRLTILSNIKGKKKELTLVSEIAN
jgi:hypothetical protein